MNKYKVYYTIWVEVEAKMRWNAEVDAHNILKEELKYSHFDVENIPIQRVEKQETDE